MSPDRGALDSAETAAATGLAQPRDAQPKEGRIRDETGIVQVAGVRRLILN
jgi:hypothetical protein